MGARGQVNKREIKSWPCLGNVCLKSAIWIEWRSHIAMTEPSLNLPHSDDCPCVEFGP